MSNDTLTAHHVGQYVTDGAAQWINGWSPRVPEAFERAALRRGRGWLKRINVPSRSDDVALLAYLAWKGMGKLYHEGDLNDDYLIAGELLDDLVTDHDAELLCELVPLPEEAPVGGMTPHVTSVHTLLLHLVGAMREAWQARQQEGDEA